MLQVSILSLSLVFLRVPQALFGLLTCPSAIETGQTLADVLDLHGKELYQKNQDLEKQAEEIRVLQTIIRTLSEPSPSVRPGPRVAR